jgi:adenosylcobinamide-GDP ribazoletransferase
MQALRHFLLAVQFFTRVPVTGRLAQWVGFNQAMLRASSAHFPGVGWLVGGVVAALSAGLLAALPATALTPLAVAALGTAAGVYMTGAFHEDGLADVADGLGGSADRERALVIMKDSRVGAFGAITITLALLCKIALLALLGSLSATLMVWGLFIAHVASRSFPLLLIRGMRHVGDDAGSKSKPLAEQISAGALAGALVWLLAACALVAWAAPVVPWWAGLAAAALACAWMWRWFARRLQGFTGDCLGATQQTCELAFYLGLALAWGQGG